MGVFLANLVFEPPPWPMLKGIAFLGLLWEAVALLLACRKGHSWGSAVLVTLGSLLAGPILAVSAGLYSVMTHAHGEPFRGRHVLTAAVRGTLIVLLGLVLLNYGQSNQPGTVAVLGMLGILWSFRSYHRTTSPIAPPKKALLVSLRVLAVLVLMIWSAGASFAWTEYRYVSGTILIGIDTSASMQRRDATLTAATQPDDEDDLVTRIDAVKQNLGRCDDRLARIAKDAQIKWFTFDQAAFDREDYPTGDGVAVNAGLGTADGKATAIGDSSLAAVDKLVDKDLLAVLLISDGRNNTAARFAPERFAELMAARKIPVYAACVGAEKVTKATHTLSVKDLQVPDRVETLNRLPFSAAIEAMGLVGRTIRVTTIFGDTTIDTRSITVMSDEELIPIQTVHVPLRGGYCRLTVRAELTGPPIREFSGQAVASKLVHVADSELRVLYVEGKFRFEVKFITQALAAAQRFTVDRRILLEPVSADKPNGLPNDLEGWLAYHAIIFGDVTPDRFTPAQLGFIRQAVRDYGKGFCMIGGDKAFGKGGWQDTPIADVLGVDLATSVGDLGGELHIKPVPGAVANELMKIGKDGDDHLGAWDKLPPLPGANKLAGVKPAATVLATAQDQQPLIVAQNYSKGRALAIAFDTTWNWVLNKDDTADYQRRFWRQVALYLSNPTGNLWMETDRTTYELPKLVHKDEIVTLRLGVEDSKGVPLPKAPVTVTVTLPTGEERQYTVPPGEAPATDGLGEKMVRTLDLDPPTVAGVYILKAQAEVEGKKLLAEHRFEVVTYDLEAMDVLANPSLMRRIARISRGAGAGDDVNEPHYRHIGRLDELLDQIKIQAEPRPEPVRMIRNLSAEFSWPIIITFIALLCLEWALRKRMGLV